jgi:hypothetical protein
MPKYALTASSRASVERRKQASGQNQPIVLAELIASLFRPFRRAKVATDRPLRPMPSNPDWHEWDDIVSNSIRPKSSAPADGFSPALATCSSEYDSLEVVRATEPDPSFWDFYMPQIQAGADGARRAIREGDHEFGHHLLDSVDDQINAARRQTDQQIADRDADKGTPKSRARQYSENGEERSKHHKDHQKYQADPTTPQERREHHRKNVRGEK